MTIQEISKEFLFWSKDRVNSVINKEEDIVVPKPTLTIIAIDGFLGGWPSRGLNKHFKNKNINFFFLDFGYQLSPVENYVNKLHTFITQNKIQKPILLGYSMGGLIAFKYTQKHGWNKITKLITVASPLKGTPKAKYFSFVKAAKDMSPNSEFMKKLSSHPIPKNKMISVTGLWDQTVPPKNATLPGAQSIILNTGGHSILQNNTKTIIEIIEKQI